MRIRSSIRPSGQAHCRWVLGNRTDPALNPIIEKLRIQTECPDARPD